MSTYIHSVEQWCNRILEKIIETSDFRNDEQLIKEEFIQFKNDLSAVIIDDYEAERKALELFEKLKTLTAKRIPQSLTSVPIGGHTLPPLPYDYAALEPHISQEIMRLHHDKHHKSYVDGLNKAELELQKARESNDFQLIKHWSREAAFNGAGHYLHTIFWNIMSPRGGGEPHSSIRREIEKSFGSFDKFKRQFSEAAEKVEGSGWAILVWSPRSRRLEILQAEKHQNLSQWDVIPLLVLDVWEHSYYLQYKNDRKKYIEAWWKVVNWPEVERRYKEAQKVSWMPY